MTDIDPEREWFYSITVHPVDHRMPEHLTGVTEQGMCTTLEQLVNGVVYKYTGTWAKVRSIQVHTIRRNDL